MSQILSQDEVDALMKGISEGDVQTESKSGSAGGAKASEPFDFASQDRVVRGSMPTLDMIHDRFARSFRSTISSATRRSIDVTAQSHEMIKFADFMRQVPLPSSLHIFKMEPLKGLSVCVLEGQLVFALIDHFFGGHGGGHVKLEGREFTPIEQRIIKMVVDLILQDYMAAWQPLYAAKMEYMGSEINPQFVNVVPGSDIVVSTSLDVELEQSSGKLRFCLPYATLEPIRDKLKSGFQNQNFERDYTWANRLKGMMRNVSVNLKVNLGSTEIAGRDLLQLKVGDVITLNETQDTPLRIYVEGAPKYLGYLGAFRGNNALKIETPIIDKERESNNG